MNNNFTFRKNINQKIKFLSVERKAGDFLMENEEQTLAETIELLNKKMDEIINGQKNIVIHY